MQAVVSLKDATTEVKDLLEQFKAEGEVPDASTIGQILDKAVATIGRTITEASEAQKELVSVTRQQQKEFERQKNTLGNLASLGIMAACFGHETTKAANLLALRSKQLERNMRQGLFMVLPDMQQDIDRDLQIISNEAKRITTFAEFTLGNVSRSKRERKDVYLNTLIQDVFSHFQRSLEERNIAVQLDLPITLDPIRAFPIDWESIVINFITNSIWALQETPKGNRIIRVNLQQVKETLQLTFADSGYGLEAHTEDKIFQPTFSTRRNERGDIIGTGMGLTIVKGFVDSYEGGKIEVIPCCDLGGAEFSIQVNIPHRRGGKNE
ncbi:MAG: HAMP domain-containing histidine kinase [Ardenticatenales bacterium]|nr:HAMP domain-containing histidine kinase [Ardenticatenales bacterium]